MCGLAGQYLFDAASQVDPDLLRGMSERLRHRGPEASGTWVDGNLGLAHVRLKLLDLRHGDQPMRGESGNMLSYVGEIYNNTELRAELLVHGYPFKGVSDTEVLLAAFEVWGERAWSRLNGMFTFAISETKMRATSLVRDRFGIKPLYYRRDENGIEFSSEPSGWFSGGSGKSIHRESLAHFLRYAQTTRGENSLFVGVQVLRPGYRLTADSEGLRVEQWWKPQAQTMSNSIEEAHVIARIRHLLHLSVGRQLVADAPLGILLSGGLDSAIITGLVSQMRDEPARTFSVVLEGDEEELAAARSVANRFHTRHTELNISSDEFFRGMDELIEIRNLPLSLPNEVLIYLLSRRAAEDVKILMSGEGADELFGGYDRILEPLERFRRATASQHHGDDLPLHALRKEWAHLDFSSTPALFSSAYCWLTNEDLHSLFLPEYRNLLKEKSPSPIESAFAAVSDSDESQQTHLVLLTLHLPHLLARLDGATMAASIEGRVPYIDNELVDYMMSLPAEMKYAPGGISKPLLRRAFADVVGEKSSFRTKRAFHASPQTLFESAEGEKRLRELRKSPALSEFFNMDQLNLLIDQDRGKHGYLKTWLLYSCHAWLVRNMC